MSDEFDLDAWVKGVALPERTVDICGKPDLIAEHEAAVRDLQKAQADERLGGGIMSTARRVQELEQQMQAATRTFRVRALTREQADEVDAAEEKDRPVVWVRLATVDPQFTAEQVAHLRDALGPQWTAWLNACTGVHSEKPTVPFSYAASRVLARQDS